MTELTVFIGRFSPFHLGHAEVLSRALSRSKNVLVLIGSSFLSRSIKNPFTFEERSKMIRDWCPKKYQDKLIIGTLRDYPYNDQLWIAETQKAVNQVINEHLGGITTKPKLTGANRDESCWYLKAFGNFFDLDIVEESTVRMTLSATEVRNHYFGGDRGLSLKALVPGSTYEFLCEFSNSEAYASLVSEFKYIEEYKKSWEKAPYAPTFVTVDAVVVQSGHVLVIERADQPGQGLWALPGGFVEQKERLLDACVRELNEETRIEMSDAQLYGSVVGRGEIFDHPGRSMRGRTITTAFLFKLRDTFALPKVKPQPGEVQKVFWLPISEALECSDKWFEDHHAIVQTMVGRL